MTAKQLQINSPRYLLALLSDRTLWTAFIQSDYRIDFDPLQYCLDLARDKFKSSGVVVGIEYLKDNAAFIMDGVLSASTIRYLDEAIASREAFEQSQDKNAYVNDCRDILRQTLISQKLLSLSEDKKDPAKLDALEGQLGISNPFQDPKASNGKPKAYSFDDLMAINESQLLEDTALINEGFLCRKEMSSIIAGEGSGKSILVTQLAMSWAQGKGMLGFNPYKGKELRTLILNAEDAPLKNHRMVKSISNQIGTPKDNVQWLDGTFPNYSTFIKELQSTCLKFHPDVIIINPLYKYAQKAGGTNLKDDEDVGEFLKCLEPIMAEFDCHILLVHHLRKDKTAGYGNSLLDWAWRSKIMLVEVSKGTFKFNVEKRTTESGAIHNSQLRWSETAGEYFWFSDGRVIERGGKHEKAILEAINGHPLTFAELLRQTGISKSSLHDCVKRLQADGKIDLSDEDKYFIPLQWRHRFSEIFGNNN